VHKSFIFKMHRAK